MRITRIRALGVLVVSVAVAVGAMYFATGDSVSSTPPINRGRPDAVSEKLVERGVADVQGDIFTCEELIYRDVDQADPASVEAGRNAAVDCIQDLSEDLDAEIAEMEADSEASDALWAAVKRSPDFRKATGKYKGCMAQAGYPAIGTPDDAAHYEHPGRAKVQATPPVSITLGVPTTTVPPGAPDPAVAALDAQTAEIATIIADEAAVALASYDCEISSGYADLVADFVASELSK